jgi:CSLREA domain-containing protein
MPFLASAGSRPNRALRALATTSLLFLALAVSAPAATFVVTTTADGNNTACTVALCTLRDAVIAANLLGGSNIITLPSNASKYTLTLTGVNEDLAATGDLDVTSNLTINGGGQATTIIDGNGTDRVFEVFGTLTSLTLNDLTVQNGGTGFSSLQGGGGILAHGGILILNNSTVRGNDAADGQGGGINASSLNLGNSNVIGNFTTNQGGGIFATDVAIHGSLIDNNHSTGDQGGGIFLINSGGTIFNSTVSHNTSLDDGGGIYLNGSISAGSPASLSIDNSTILGNTGLDGGGIFILSFATVSIGESTLIGNTATTAGGGGINNDAAALFLTNCTIFGNTNSGGVQGGGALFNNGASAAATITNCTIDGNTAPAGTGGGIRNNGGTVTLKNTIISGNTSENCVGTITNGGTNLQFPGTSCGAGITAAEPILLGITFNGGPTATQALGAGSPAINAASGCPPPTSDQRGVSRPQGSACEIGAFECQAGECVGGAVTGTPTPTPTNTPVNTPINTPPNTATNTPTQGPAPTAVVPTLSFPMIVLLAMALAGTAMLLMRRG